MVPRTLKHPNPNRLTMERSIFTKFHFIKALSLILTQKSNNGEISQVILEWSHETPEKADSMFSFFSALLNGLLYSLLSEIVPLPFFEHLYKNKKGKNTSLILEFNRQSGIPVWNVKLLTSTCRTKLNFQIFYLFIYLAGLKVILVPVIFLVKALW